MRSFKWQQQLFGMLFGAAAWLSWGEPVCAQELDGVDQMVRTALQEFETSLPILEVEGNLACADRQVDEVWACLEPRASVVIADFAAEVGAELLFDEPPLPACGWNEANRPARNGVRISLQISSAAEGVIWILVNEWCEDDPERYFNPNYGRTMIYPFRIVDGEWKRCGEVITIVT